MAPVIQSERYFWPPPPDQPRIEWLKAYSSQLDLDKTSTQRFWTSILGEDAPISLAKPVEVKSDTVNNKLFVSDLQTPAVFVFDFSKHELRHLSTGETGPPITYPLSLALDRSNNLYLLERHFNNIIVFDQLEKVQRSFNLDNLCKKPVAMTIDLNNNHLLVADGAANKIHVLDLFGNQLFSFGGPGEEDGQFNLPVAMTTNSRGEILIVDTFNARVQIFDPKGAFRRKFGKRGDGAGDFQLIKSIAVDSDDNIYVADGRSNRISIFNTSGELLLVFGDFYAISSTGKRAPGGFAVPVGIDIDSNDKIYIVDQLNSRIQIFQYLSDRYLKQNPITSLQDSKSKVK